MPPIHYFAYGSNMLRERLLARKVRVLGAAQPAVAEGYRLVFNKESVDGSSKANLTAEAGAKTWGVLFSVDPASLSALNDAEGAPDHYQHRYKFPVAVGGKTVEAMTYIAHPDKTAPTPGEPYDWYLALILAGAKSHSDMPAEWITQLQKVGPSKPDTKTPARKTFTEAVAQLKAAGYANWRELLQPAIHPCPSVSSVVK